MAPQFHFDTSHIDWMELQGGDEFDYPIHYSMAVLGTQPEVGSLDLLVKFEPNSYCHFHKHVAATTTLVLQGEQHVYDISPDGEETHQVRPAGTYRRSAGGDLHMERGGPDGALVFFGLQTTDGRLFDLLDKDLNVLTSTTVEELAAAHVAA